MTPTAAVSKSSRAKAAVALETRRYAIFRRHQQFFGINVELVREVLHGQPLTPVPRAGAEILGVLSLRGEILPVVVIDELLGLKLKTDDPLQPILVLRRGELLAGLRVDAIQGVASVPTADVQLHPGGAAGSLLAGIWHPKGQSTVTLINGSALLETLSRRAAQQSVTSPIQTF
jgi:purine-binding chemotaxis protein CheW